MFGRMLTLGAAAPIDHALTWLIQSTVLLACGLLAGRWLRRWGPAVQSASYRTTLVAVLVCPIASGAMAALGFDGLMIRLPRSSEGTEAPVVVAGRLEATADREAPRLPAGSDPLPKARTEAFLPIADRDERIGGPAPALETPRDVVTATPPPAAPAPVAPPQTRGWPVGFVAVAWLFGAVALVARLLVGHRRMARLRSSAIPAEPEDEVLCEDLARGMQLVPPAVLRSPFLFSPCLDGLRRPAILLPEDTWANLRETFVHELAHLARRDGLWNLLRNGATAVFWMQPLLWILSRRLEETAEEVCDDIVVALGADRGRYAGHLLELAERQLPPLAPAGVGMISFRSLLSRRITRILDSTRTLSTRAGRRVIVATLAAGFAGTLLAGLLGVGGGGRDAVADEPKPDQSAAEPARAAERKTVTGRVVDPEDKPVAGAIVTVARYRSAGIGPYGSDADRKEISRAVADADGRFTLTYDGLDPAMLSQDPESPDRWKDACLVASAPGFGPTWVREGSIAAEVTAEKPLRLVRDDVPITGRIVDLEGRPVAEATVRVLMVWKPQSAEAVDRWLKAVDQGPSSAGEDSQSRYFPVETYLPGNEPTVPPPVTTDADGRFRLTGLGRDRQAVLAISGPTIAFRRYQVVTRRMNRVKSPSPGGAPLFDESSYGADCTLVAEPGRPIEGVVRDADTKAPIPGVVVIAQLLADSTASIEGLIAATTDAEGRYRLVGLPKASGHRLSAYPPLDQPYFITEFLKVPAGPGLGAVQYDIPLKRGIWITGRVADAQSHRPVQAAIHYYPFLANDRAKDYRNFDANQWSMFWTGSRYRTDADGRFRVVGLPGRGIVGAKTFDRSYRLGVGADTIPERPRQRAGREEGLPTYNQIHPRQFQTLVAIDPPAGVEELRRDLTVEPTPSLAVQLVDPQGQPLTHVEAWGRFPAGVDVGDLNLSEQSRTQIVGLEPRSSRTVVFQHDERKLGAVLVITPEDVAKGGERTVVLRPCATVTGRLVDADGKPVKGAVEPHLRRADGEQPEETVLFPVSLDADGRFRIDNVIPGATYTLHARDRLALGLDARGRMEPRRFKPFELARDVKAEAGQVIDLGTFNAATGTPDMPSQKATTPKTAQTEVRGLKATATKPAPRGVTRDGQPVKVADGKLPIIGRIVDLEGRPVAGVQIGIISIVKPKGGNLDPWLAAVKRGEPPWISTHGLEFEADPLAPELKRFQATTDADGRFRIDGIGPERSVVVRLQGPAIGYNQLEIVTRRMESIPAKGFPTDYGSEEPRIYGAEFTFAAAPGRPIEGVVRDATTRKPVAGVLVETNHFAGAVMHGITTLKATTDAQGRFRIVGMPKGRGNQILIIPTDEQPYFMREADVSDPPGLAPVTMEIDLHKGIWIEGKVADAETGQPVPRAQVHYLPFLDNPFAQATPEFDGHGNYSAGAMIQDRYQTNDQGAYRLVGLPGRAIVGVVSPRTERPYLQGAGSESIKGMDQRGHFPTYRNPVNPGKLWPTAMKEINPPDGTQSVHLDIPLVAGAKVRVRVVDAQGRPVTDLSPAGQTARGRHENNVLRGSEFEVVALASDEDRMVLVRQDQRKLGKVFHVQPGDDKNGPVVVTVEPLATITGRILDADGNLVSGATIRSDPQPGGNFSLSLGQVASGREGRFTVPNVPAGCKYALVVVSGIGSRDRRVAFSNNVSVRAGETTDVGDIRFRND